MPSNRTEVRPSLIHGMGLFATVNIRKGFIATSYRGEVIDKGELERRYGKECAIYVVNLGNGRYLDGRDPLTSGKGRYANDARGTEFRVNGKIVTYFPGDSTYIIATRMIHKGEEILVDYGEDYWSLVWSDQIKK